MNPTNFEVSMVWTKFKRFLVGEPLTTQFAAHERIPKWKALSTLSSDALSSVAYATDAILVVLVGFSAAAAIWSIPIALAIVALLAILTLSYWQTITAYPNGGGAYLVVKENLGQTTGLVAGGALLIDYILTVAVSVAAGVENIASAFPWLLTHKEIACTAVIILIMVMNLRGIKDSATAFAFPTYFFIASMFIMLAVGFWRLANGEVPDAAPIIDNAYPAVPMVLFLRAFAAGCSALTGIEAISDGVPVFRDPAAKNARITLLWMSAILGALFVGVTTLVHGFKILPEADQTIVSLLGRSVFGGSTAMYFAVQISTALILFLAANTAYTDFPRVASLLARDRFAPRQLASLGDRLVYSNGITGLSFFAIVLIFIFSGSTLNLIPLYAVGVFLSFTLSQSGMVVRHLKGKVPGYWKGVAFNAFGAFTTGIILIDIAWTKFAHGAWMVVIAIPFLVILFKRIYAHYVSVGKELALAPTDSVDCLKPVQHSVIVPVSGIHRGVLEALRYARSISNDVRACYVELDTATTENMMIEWKKWAPDIPFVVLKSPYRSVIQPLIKYIDDVELMGHDDMVTVVVPEFVTTKWWHRVLHNQTALFIRAALLFKPRKVVTSVRYHLRGE